MKYIVYLTTNLKNRYIYIGVHLTETPYEFDGYYGCGIYRTSSLKNPKTKFQYALKTYGFDSFERRTLKVFNTAEEAYLLEKELVDSDFIKRYDTYNMIEGGSYINPEKEVFLYDLQGNFIMGWKSIKCAAKELNIYATAISLAAIYSTTCNKSLWTFYKVDTLQLQNFTIYDPEIELFLYDSEGNFYKKFNSFSEVALKFNTSTSHITRAIKCNYKINGFYITKEFFEKFKVPEFSSKLIGKVHLYSLEGKYLQSYNSIKEVEKVFNENMQGINSSIKLHKQYKGFLWLRGEKQDYIKPLKVTKGIARKVGQYSLDGQLIKVFNSVREARIEFKSINRVLKGIQNTCKGYTFKYIS